MLDTLPDRRATNWATGASARNGGIDIDEHIAALRALALADLASVAGGAS